jgi:hypothetical protein
MCIRKVWRSLHQFFTKFAKAQQCYIQICYTQYRSNWIINMVRTDINSIYAHQQSVDFRVLLFTQLRVYQYISCTESCLSQTKNIEFMDGV